MHLAFTKPVNYISLHSSNYFTHQNMRTQNMRQHLPHVKMKGLIDRCTL